MLKFGGNGLSPPLEFGIRLLMPVAAATLSKSRRETFLLISEFGGSAALQCGEAPPHRIELNASEAAPPIVLFRGIASNFITIIGVRQSLTALRSGTAARSNSWLRCPETFSVN
jgi:hypothetical protein